MLSAIAISIGSLWSWRRLLAVIITRMSPLLSSICRKAPWLLALCSSPWPSRVEACWCIRAMSGVSVEGSTSIVVALKARKERSL